MNRAYFATDANQVYCMSGPRFDLAPAGLPDWEDAPKTMNDPEPYALEAVATVRAPATYPPPSMDDDVLPETLSRPGSYVRELSPDVTAPMTTSADASAFLDTMSALPPNLQMSILSLRDAD